MGKELVVAEFAEEQADREIEDAVDGDGFIDAEFVEDDAARADVLLGEADATALEEGIASIFGTLLAEADDGDDANLEDAPGADMTFVLLDELNRLWAQAA
jgi:hypothetical protein